MLTWLFRAINSRTQAHLKDIPGPGPRFPFGTATDFFGPWPWEVCAEYGRRHGGIALVWLFNKPAVVLNDPELIGAVLDTQAQDFYKDAPVRALRPVITSESLFITNFGRGWESARREHAHRLVAGGQAMVERLLLQPRGECVMGKLGRRSVLPQRLQGAPVENTAAGLAGLVVRHVAQLIV